MLPMQKVKVSSLGINHVGFITSKKVQGSDSRLESYNYGLPSARRAKNFSCLQEKQSITVFKLSISGWMSGVFLRSLAVATAHYCFHAGLNTLTARHRAEIIAYLPQGQWYQIH